MRVTSFVVMLCLAVSACHGRTIIVDVNGAGDYSAIQAAIDAASEGDTILVQPGTYNERVNFNGRAVTVTGSDPNNWATVSGTIIRGNGIGHGVIFDSGEDARSKLIGIAVSNHNSCIRCWYSSPVISHCLIEQNTHGMSCAQSEPLIEECIIRDNRMYGIIDCHGDIVGCTISGNGEDGLINCFAEVRNSTISGNGNFGVQKVRYISILLPIEYSCFQAA